MIKKIQDMVLQLQKKLVAVERNKAKRRIRHTIKEVLQSMEKVVTTM